MKKKILCVGIMMCTTMIATVTVDNIDRKYVNPNIIEKTQIVIEEVKENFEVKPEPIEEIEVVNEYILAMEGSIC